MGLNDTTSVELIKFLKANFPSECVIFLHAFPLLAVYSHIFSM